MRYGKARQSSRERKWKDVCSFEIWCQEGPLRGRTRICHEIELGGERWEVRGEGVERNFRKDPLW